MEMEADFASRPEAAVANNPEVQEKFVEAEQNILRGAEIITKARDNIEQQLRDIYE